MAYRLVHWLMAKRIALSLRLAYHLWVVIDASMTDAASDTYLFDDLLADEIEQIRGTRRWVDLADQIGVKEGMIRAYAKGSSDAGVNTLAPILSWDLERSDVDTALLASQMPRLAQLVFLKLVNHGLRLRQKAISDRAAREAAHTQPTAELAA
jgi:hypothetical protein